jgi:hypothetical protein
VALLCCWKITSNVAVTVTLVLLCGCLRKESLAKYSRLCGIENIFYHFQSYWNIKTNLSFNPKKAVKPPHRTRKSLDILSHLTVSAPPLSGDTIENRTAILVRFPTDSNTVAFVYLVMSLVTSKYPNAPWMWIRNRRNMYRYDKSQWDLTGKIMLIRETFDLCYSESEVAARFRNY